VEQKASAVLKSSVPRKPGGTNNVSEKTASFMRSTTDSDDQPHGMCPEATVPHVKADFSVHQRSSAAHHAKKKFTILRTNTLSK
jgi:hypothetical protein